MGTNPELTWPAQITLGPRICVRRGSRNVIAILKSRQWIWNDPQRRNRILDRATSWIIHTLLNQDSWRKSWNTFQCCEVRTEPSPPNSSSSGLGRSTTCGDLRVSESIRPTDSSAHNFMVSFICFISDSIALMLDPLDKYFDKIFATCEITSNTWPVFDGVSVIGGTKPGVCSQSLGVDTTEIG